MAIISIPARTYGLLNQNRHRLSSGAGGTSGNYAGSIGSGERYYVGMWDYVFRLPSVLYMSEWHPKVVSNPSQMRAQHR